MQKTTCKENEETEKALSAYVKLMRAAESLSARIHRSLADIGLTVSQFGALEALYHLGAMTQVEIGKKILRSAGNVTVVIDNLEKRGLVTRRRSTDDRRSFKVHLTREGKYLVKKVFPVHAERISAEMSVLTAAEQGHLGYLCKRLGLGKKTNNKTRK